MANGFSFKLDGFDDLYDRVREFHFRIRQLARHAVFVGALRAVGDKSVEFMQMICAVQNRGCTIRPVNGKYLTIPMPVAHGKRVADFGRYSQANPKGLFFHISATSGNPTLARRIDGTLQVVFLLYKQVNIPARGFIDATADECMYHVREIVDEELQSYWDGQSNYIHTFNRIGRYLQHELIFRIQSWQSPPNARITELGKGENDPLVDTGALQRSITWVII